VLADASAANDAAAAEPCARGLDFDFEDDEPMFVQYSNESVRETSQFWHAL
jgi:hypothetical protein